jgi:N-acetyl-alpha-D-glucosaminyl L-malate synthase BshA
VDWLKVLVVSNMYPSDQHPAYGGFVESQVQALRETGIQVDLAVIRDRRKGLAANLRKYLGLLVDLFKLRKGNYDVYHVHYLFPTGLLALPFAILSRTPLVVTAHGGDIRLGKKKEFRLLTSLILRHARAVISVSEALAAEIRESFAVDHAKIGVASCGVDLSLFYPRDKQVCKDALNIQSKKTLLFVGNFVPVKGIPVLIEAFVGVADSEPDAVLCLLGEGPLQEELKAQAQALGIGDRCRWLTPVEHNRVPEVMSAAELLVLPSRHEGFGLVALEALACGVPVVATRVGGVPEIVADGECGFLVEPADISGLGAAVSRLLADEPLRVRFGEAGYHFAKKHDKALQIEKIRRIYGALTGYKHD